MVGPNATARPSWLRPRSAPDPRPAGLRVGRILLLLATLITPAASFATEPPAGAGEYELKAAFLFNFVKFTAWPELAAPGEHPLVVTVLGDAPFGDALDALDGRRVRERKIEIRRAQSLDQIAACDALFVSRDETPRLDQILELLHGRSVLTVGESPDFLLRGGILNLVIRENRVRFEVNVVAAERASLRISLQLLKLADDLRSDETP